MILRTCSGTCLRFVAGASDLRSALAFSARAVSTETRLPVSVAGLVSSRIGKQGVFYSSSSADSAGSSATWSSEAVKMLTSVMLEKDKFYAGEMRKKDTLFAEQLHGLANEVAKLKAQKTLLEARVLALMNAAEGVRNATGLRIYLERWSSVAAFVAEKPHLRKPAAYLEALCADKDFNDFLNAAICSFSQRSPGAANVPLRADDVKRCIKQLYHSPSKDHHGASPGQLLISPDAVKYKADVAAACLLLEYQRTPYTYQDSTGATVPTPFDTQSIEKKIPAFLTVAAEQSSQ